MKSDERAPEAMASKEQTPRLPFRLFQYLRRLTLSVLRWIVAAPPKKPRSAFRKWASRAILLLCVAWLCIWGPGNLLLPIHPGFTSLSDKNITVYYQNQTSDLAGRVLADARAAVERCRGFWGEPPGGLNALSIYLCDSHGAYLQLSFGAGGNACCAGSSLLLYPAGVGKQNLAAVICHEMSHAFLRQHVGNWQAFKAPVWLDEGIATYLGETTWASAKALRTQLEAMPRPEIISMQSLTSRPDWLAAALRGPGAVPRLYASARSFVDYLAARWGKQRLLQLVNHSLLEKVDDAFASVYEARLSEVEQDWLAHEIDSEHLPPKTLLVQSTPGLLAEIRFFLPYAVILFGIFWGIRQCFIFGRLLLRPCCVSSSKCLPANPP